MGVKTTKRGFAAAVTVIVVLLALLVCDERLTAKADSAVLEQEAAYAAYQSMLACAAEASVTVTENGQVIGTYSLEELGLLQQTEEAVALRFSDQEQMLPDAYRKLPLQEKLKWYGVPHPENPEVRIDVEKLQTACIWEDLQSVSRKQPEDAYPYFENGVFLTQAEKAGTVLLKEPIDAALKEAAEALVISAGVEAKAVVELTELNCYAAPVITVENADFDYPALLNAALEGQHMQLQFVDQTVTLDADALRELLTVDADGVVHPVEGAVQAQVQTWAEAFDKVRTPFMFNSYLQGYVPISFLKVDYTLDQAALCAQLCEQLPKLDFMAVTAPMDCRKYKGDPLDMGDTYVEVDIENQVMTYFKDGEVVVSTDVVTGHPDGHMTPRGYYNIYNKDTDCWLIGADYCVFVEYWVGIRDVYGIHDASWRSKFGGKLYKTNGSHGCVNTPTEPMKIIHETIEIGTPCLIF